jgi:hypothetical protein
VSQEIAGSPNGGMFLTLVEHVSHSNVYIIRAYHKKISVSYFSNKIKIEFKMLLQKLKYY